MPQGKTHDQITLAAGAASIPMLLAILPDTTDRPIMLGAGLTGLLVSGMLCSPDMDTDSVVYYRWGALRWLWYPYKRLIAHRSWLSHGWIAGPALRLLYLLAVVYGIAACAMLILGGELQSLNRAVTRYAGHSGVWYALGGWWLGSALHTAADRLVSRLKRKRRKTRRRSAVVAR